jgi:hypothetical protein
MLAAELTAWMQLLALTEHEARRWEPNGSGCDSSPFLRRWPGPADESCSIVPTRRLGLGFSPRPCIGYAPSPAEHPHNLPVINQHARTVETVARDDTG